MYKRLTPCIFIERGKAVQWFDDRTVIADDVMELCQSIYDRFEIGEELDEASK